MCDLWGGVEEREISEEVRVGVCAEYGERYYPPVVVDRLRNIERSIMDRKRLKKLLKAHRILSNYNPFTKFINPFYGFFIFMLAKIAHCQVIT